MEIGNSREVEGADWTAICRVERATSEPRHCNCTAAVPSRPLPFLSPFPRALVLVSYRFDNRVPQYLPRDLVKAAFAVG